MIPLIYYRRTAEIIRRLLALLATMTTPEIVEKRRFA